MSDPKKINVLGIPMDLGAGRRGVDMGPSALRLAQLARTLEELGHDVEDLGNVEVPVPEAIDGSGSLMFADAIAAACRLAYRQLADLPPEVTPLSLGGDHSVSMGTIAGVARRGGRTGVLWLDAHADLNTPDTSPSQNVHGMPLAHLLGLGDGRLLDIWGGGRVVEPADVVYVGLRSLDEGERVRIRELGITAFTMKDIDQAGVAAITGQALDRLASCDRIHLSFDADALDPHIAPGVGTPVSGGLTYREAHLIMELLSESGRIGSVDLVEVNPFLDERNSTAAIMVEMTSSLFGKRIL